MVAVARSFVAGALGHERADPLFLVAVSEVITNAVEEHGRIGSDEAITIAVDAGSATVKIADRGRGFEPGSQRPTSPGSLEDRGRGLVIARAVAAGLTWEPNHPTGTIFVLPCPPSPSR